MIAAETATAVTVLGADLDRLVVAAAAAEVVEAGGKS